MKNFKTRFIALCGLVVLSAATLASVVANAACPVIFAQCSDGSVRSCQGTTQGTKCVYEHDCLNC